MAAVLGHAGLAARHQVAGDQQAGAARGFGHQAQLRLLARAGVGVEQFVAAHGVEARALQRQQAEVALRKTLAEGAVGSRVHQGAVGCCQADGASGIQLIVTVQRHLQADQAAQRLAVLHAQLQRQCMRLAPGAGVHAQQAAGMAVPPGGVVSPHLEGAGLVQQLPLASDLHEHPQALRAELPQGASHRAHEAVDAHMALRDHGMEHATHPAGGGQGAFIGREVVAGAQHVAVRAQHLALLGAQHGVAGALEVRQQRAVGVAFHLLPWAFAPALQLGFAQVLHGQQRGGGEQAHRLRRRACGCRPARWATGLGQGQGVVHPGQVGRAAGLGMMRLQQAEEAHMRVCAGRQRERLVLQRCQRVLVLQTRAGQALGAGEGRLPMALAQAQPLQLIGGPGHAAAQRAGEQPGVEAGHGQVLACGQHRAHARVGEGRVVQVMAHVELVGAQGSPGRE